MFCPLSLLLDVPSRLHRYKLGTYRSGNSTQLLQVPSRNLIWGKKKMETMGSSGNCVFHSPNSTGTLLGSLAVREGVLALVNSSRVSIDNAERCPLKIDLSHIQEVRY